MTLLSSATGSHVSRKGQRPDMHCPSFTLISFIHIRRNTKKLDDQSALLFLAEVIFIPVNRHINIQKQAAIAQNLWSFNIGFLPFYYFKIILIISYKYFCKINFFKALAYIKSGCISKTLSKYFKHS